MDENSRAGKRSWEEGSVPGERTALDMVGEVSSSPSLQSLITEIMQQT